MDEILAIEINRIDWIKDTSSGLFYSRDIRGLDAETAVDYCWSKLDRDETLRNIISRYVTEYSFHISEILNEFDPSEVDIELLDDVFNAICLEEIGLLKLNDSDYDFDRVKIASEGLHHYLINEHNIHEILTDDLVHIW